MDMQAAFRILELPEDASLDDIKTSYRRLMKQHHPDTNRGESSSRLPQIMEAYRYLVDHQTMLKQARKDPPSDIAAAFSDLLKTLNEQHQTADRFPPVKGIDLFLVLRIARERAERGGKIRIQRSRTFCGKCAGQGLVPTEVPAGDCYFCSGLGVIMQGRGLIQVRSACDFCSGAGTDLYRPCGTCGGAGFRAAISETIILPSPCHEGYVHKLAGRGGIGYHGGPHGDLNIRFKYKD